MRDKRFVLGILTVLACVLAAVFGIGGTAQAAPAADHRSEAGVVVTLPPAPAGAQLRSDRAAGAPGTSPAVHREHRPGGTTYTCPSGNLCANVWDPTTGDWVTFYFYTCKRYGLSNWSGTGNYRNAQTGSVTSYFYGQGGNVLWTSTPGPADHGADWGPVWSIRNC
ncbi:hypothetical protein NX801_28255 [Streptomyces sp. LP05-1]|uniref:Secreted protein n=1 Tax=Streptomyces pyxinae TaxID=2970734 RepID=A0ABT2CPU3_9ACTN|nr:hypothetical protein [Streptomyces sp. LP05-1]MCS0639457.1 hypothetical protein [Streptomyces sp. LP05-1]